MKNAGPAAVFLLTQDQLDAVADAAVERARLASSPANDAPSALLDRNALAAALSCSLPSLDRMRKAGLPTIWIGDSPRFDLNGEVLPWLRARRAGGAK